MLLAEKLAGLVDQLAKHGIQRKQPGVDDATGELVDVVKEKSSNPNYDPLGYRIGKPPGADVAKVLKRTADECRAVVDVKQAERKIPLSKEKIDEAIQNIKGAVMIAYPMNLPEHDEVRIILDGKADIQAAVPQEAVDPKTCVLWFSRKRMERNQVLSKYCGRNEKMFLKVRLQTKNQRMPQREARLDKDAQTKMYSYWHKKNEEDKRLKEEAEDDDYLNSAWANPKAFKQSFSGIRGGVKWR
mmetsp:Transcript_9075/g.16635  ORF Transcript_9075/g.16635 Transcript_9075/m.16635 type:complete len:243 (+) Transcript_9075:270-998(+)|eukprot:CAMPEP_0197521404 /NCGR_PEP_ID=MMETSP1318-20131121/6677_1 /TAXON_ID=552666 /ORGANISM="Partenskyella glossopodia, Strain RCC365" /LENGTH=242 /DNA_ID=CAMNT_0043073391 /DNA_START=239 /DNA_END=967 /DNA_ORIENTATION=-